MNANIERSRLFAAATTLALASIATLAGTCSAYAQGTSWVPGNLVVSGSVYVNAHTIVAGQTVLPPDCSVANCPTPVTAVVGSTYPYVFNNDTVDGSFGITSLIFLDQITPKGELVSTLEVPNSTQSGIGPTSDQLVTSFSSKSELALNLSTAGDVLTFVGYVAPIGAIDVSNANTPGEFDLTNPVGTSYYRAVAQVDTLGKFHFTETNAYSGDNGRAAILDDGADLFYTAGNAGNGGTPQPVGIIIGAGAQIMTPADEPESVQTPGAPTPVGSFNVAQLGDKLDKAGKDTNFRGLTIFNNVLYYTKGSGSNGINTVYFVDTTGTVCTDTNGVGLPALGAGLRRRHWLTTPTRRSFRRMAWNPTICVSSKASLLSSPNRPRASAIPSASGLRAPLSCTSRTKVPATPERQLPVFTRPPRRLKTPPPDSRSGSLTQALASGNWLISLQTDWTSAYHTLCLAIRQGSIPEPADRISLGRRLLTACVTSRVL